MDGTITERLAGILERRVDPETRRRAGLHLLDWISCATLGAVAPAGRAMVDYAQKRPDSNGSCATIGAGTRSAELAAFVNGGLGNIFEMDDLHRTSIVHPGDVVIPAALAVADREAASGAALLDAIVRGYEVAIRIGAAAGTGHYAYWYNTATCGVFGAAAAAATLLGLPARATVDALGQAGMQASGLWQCRLEPTFSKQLATARAAQSGVIAADLASGGFPGAAEILEGPLGFFAATCPGADAGTVVDNPDASWRIHEVSFKPWPACRHTHPVIEAALDLRGRGANAPPRRILVTTYRAALDMCDDPVPDTPHRARFSLQHCTALALLRGEPGLDDFAPPAIADAEIAALRSKVTVREDDAMTADFPNRYGAALRIEYDDGPPGEATVQTALGDPENPMDEGAIVAKNHTLMAAAGVKADEIGRIQETAGGLVEATSAAALSRLIGEVRPTASELS